MCENCDPVSQYQLSIIYITKTHEDRSRLVLETDRAINADSNCDADLDTKISVYIN